MHATLVFCLVQVGAAGVGVGGRGMGVGDRPSPSAAAVPPAPVRDAWTSFDFYGHYDDKGVFVYSKARAHVEAARNFGVDLAGHTPPIAGEVRGTDKDLGRDLAEATLKGSAPCPGPGPCPPRRPDPDPEPDPDPLPPLGPAGGLALLPLVLAALLLLLSFFLMLTVFLVSLVRRRP